MGENESSFSPIIFTATSPSDLNMKPRLIILISSAILIAVAISTAIVRQQSTPSDRSISTPIDLGRAEITNTAAISEPSTPTISLPTATSTPTCIATLGQVVTITIPSSIYSQSIPVDIYLPPCYAEATPPLTAIYLLHGAGADQTQWPDLNVQSQSDALIQNGSRSFMVVMPGGEYRTQLDYAAFILKDVIPSIAQDYHVQIDRADQAIGGLSLGGYWALKIAFLHPQEFSAVGAYSPVVDQGQPDDPLELARSADNLPSLRIMLDVGDVDPLRVGAQQLAGQLEARSIPVAFSINPGGHNRAYWRLHTGEYLRFLLHLF